VLYALAHPLSLVVLLVAFLVGVTLRGAVQGWLLARWGMTDLSGSHFARRSAADLLNPRHHVDPFGAVAVALAGVGWGRPLPERRLSARQVLLVTLLGPLAPAVLGVGLLLLWRVQYGPAGGAVGGLSYGLQHGVSGGLGDLGPMALLLGGGGLLYLGVVHLVPLPPVDGGRLLFSLAPRTVGWQKAEHWLVERNIGLVALLALALIPLGGSQPPLPALLDIILTPLLTLVLGG
jgi:hypothetical protein